MTDSTGDYLAVYAHAQGGTKVICPVKIADEANARLIAAGPELLEALIKLANESTGFLAMADPDVHGHTNRMVLRERIRLAQDAIAKAEGR